MGAPQTRSYKNFLRRTRGVQVSRPRHCEVDMSVCRCNRAKMCWCRACAGPWKCVLECASWARTCVCSRARVHVCCAGAAGRAYSRRKRFARSRAAELPDLAASAEARCPRPPRPTAQGACRLPCCALFTDFFCNILYTASICASLELFSFHTRTSTHRTRIAIEKIDVTMGLKCGVVGGGSGCCTQASRTRSSAPTTGAG